MKAVVYRQYGLSDPITLTSVVIIVVVVSVLAASIPAFRAARIEPMRALRERPQYRQYGWFVHGEIRVAALIAGPASQM